MHTCLLTKKLEKQYGKKYIEKPIEVYMAKCAAMWVYLYYLRKEFKTWNRREMGIDSLAKLKQRGGRITMRFA